MIVFLDRDDTEGAINSLIGESKRVRIAVAYWGEGAVTRLLRTIRKGADIKVVCDLLSGGCNPEEIVRLQQRIGAEHVLKRNDLHAKVWLTERGAILGSSNASANGIGREGKATNGLIEANLRFDDPKTLEQLGLWFDNAVLLGATPISDTDLRRARNVRKGRSPAPPAPNSSALLEDLLSDPDRYDGADIFVWVYGHAAPNKQEDTLYREAQKDRGQRSLAFWGWGDEPCPPPGSYILDFNMEKRRAKSDNCVWRVLTDDPLVKNSNGTKILLCKEVRPRMAFGVQLGDKKSWELAATRAHATGKADWQIADFARRFLIVR